MEYKCTANTRDKSEDASRSPRLCLAQGIFPSPGFDKPRPLPGDTSGGLVALKTPCGSGSRPLVDSPFGLSLRASPHVGVFGSFAGYQAA